MKCKYHNNAEAKYICDKCKQPICEECSLEVNGNKLCSSCIQKSVFSSEGQYYKGGFMESFIFFCFATVPGAAQMYMNLFKRGFQLMFGFIGAIVLFSYINMESLIVLTIIPTWFFSFFDSYAIRRRLRRGENVEDETIFDYRVLMENKRAVGIVVLLLGIMGVINALEHSALEYLFDSRVYWAIKRSIIPAALIFAGAMILKRTKKNEPEEDTAEQDMEL